MQHLCLYHINYSLIFSYLIEIISIENEQNNVNSRNSKIIVFG